MKRILCIDVGNTNVVIGVSFANSDEFEFKHFRINTNHFITIDEVSMTIFNILNFWGIQKDEIAVVVVSSVVPEVDVQFRYGIKNLLELEPMFVKVSDVPMKIEYSNISEIGSDRIVDAFASKEIYGQDCIIVDTGTATTIDVVRGGVYLGGVIMPGIQTSLYAIFQKASKIPKISLDVPTRIVGKSTEECLRSGIIIGLGKGVEGMIKGIFNELGFNGFKVVFTGGLSDKIFEIVELENKLIDKDLMLKGLKIIGLKRLGI